MFNECEKTKQLNNKKTMTRGETNHLLQELGNLGIRSSLSDTQLAVMQAYIDGKPIQCHNRTLDDKDVWEDCTPCWSFQSYDYRVKPATIRPFTVPELLHYLADHLDTSRQLIPKYGGVHETLLAVDPFSGSGLVVETKTCWLTLEELADTFTFADGTPCGMVINE